MLLAIQHSILCLLKSTIQSLGAYICIVFLILLLVIHFYCSFKKFAMDWNFIIIIVCFIFREGKGGRKRGREAHSLMGTWPTTQAWALDWESNWQPSG